MVRPPQRFRELNLAISQSVRYWNGKYSNSNCAAIHFIFFRCKLRNPINIKENLFWNMTHKWTKRYEMVRFLSHISFSYDLSLFFQQQPLFKVNVLPIFSLRISRSHKSKKRSLLQKLKREMLEHDDGGVCEWGLWGRGPKKILKKNK